MAPKKKEQQKMSLGDFLADSFGGGSSWADEVEETSYVTGTQALPPSDRPRYNNNAASSWQDRGFSVREAAPQTLPDKPPYTAHLGNLSYDVTNDAVGEYLADCGVVNVRLIEDRELQRPKGFGYVEFETLDGLKKALTFDGENFNGRMIKIKVADPPRGGDPGRGDSIREMGNWDRKGPLPDAPSRGGARDFGDRERRPRDPAFESRPQREFTWERHGPLAPLSPKEGSGSRDGSRPRASPDVLGDRSESYRGNRRDSPAWGEAREGGSRPRPERPERPERTATAAEKDMQWRERMRPDAAKAASPDGSAPPSPALSNAAPAQGGRPRLNLQKRTVSEAPDASSAPQGSDAKASPFGAARPIDTAAREKEIEVKRLQAIQEKKEADEKAKEERKLAKEAAAKAEAEAAEKAEAAEAKQAAEAAEAKETAEAAAPEATEPKAEAAEGANGEQKVPIRNREPREGAPKSRATEASSWRSASSNEQRGPRGGAGPRGGRGGRGGIREARAGPLRSNGSAAQQPASTDAEPATPTADDDGWTTVPNKKGRQGRAMAP
ncbi:translation initiation factor eIF-4B [Fusarium mundagurra]|uniref:Translation initiation factor eIF-4B n=1 Tax=Fusarium mundagurra TaxID=1567541 RepID=A0A8H6DGW8_9HYPO|nr:translation initiation factor eIF-4B [Fusarium mundagurra]